MGKRFNRLSSSKESGGEQRSWSSVAAAAGSLLAGIAAIGTLLVTSMGGENPSDQAGGATTSSTAASTLTVARSLGDVGSQVAALARVRLESDDRPAYSSFERWTADDGEVEVDLPASWRDVETTTWLDDQDRVVGAAVVGALEDVDALYTGWEAEGMFLGASPQTVAPEALLASRRELRSRNCTDEGGAALDGDGLEGRYAVWSGCGGGDTIVLDLAANHRNDPGTVWLHARLTSQRDVDSLTRALESMEVDLQSVADRLGRRLPGSILP